MFRGRAQKWLTGGGSRPNCGNAYRETIAIFLRQRRDEEYFLKRALPTTAQPDRERI